MSGSSSQSFNEKDFAHTIWRDQDGDFHTICDVHFDSRGSDGTKYFVADLLSAKIVVEKTADLKKSVGNPGLNLPRDQVWFTVTVGPGGTQSQTGILNRIDFVLEKFPKQQYAAKYKKEMNIDITKKNVENSRLQMEKLIRETNSQLDDALLKSLLYLADKSEKLSEQAIKSESEKNETLTFSDGFVYTKVCCFHPDLFSNSARRNKNTVTATTNRVLTGETTFSELDIGLKNVQENRVQRCAELFGQFEKAFSDLEQVVKERAELSKMFDDKNYPWKEIMMAYQGMSTSCTAQNEVTVQTLSESPSAKSTVDEQSKPITVEKPNSKESETVTTPVTHCSNFDNIEGLILDSDSEEDYVTSKEEIDENSNSTTATVNESDNPTSNVSNASKSKFNGTGVNLNASLSTVPSTSVPASSFASLIETVPDSDAEENENMGDDCEATNNQKNNQVYDQCHDHPNSSAANSADMIDIDTISNASGVHKMENENDLTAEASDSSEFNALALASGNIQNLNDISVEQITRMFFDNFNKNAPLQMTDPNRTSVFQIISMSGAPPNLNVWHAKQLMETERFQGFEVRSPTHCSAVSDHCRRLLIGAGGKSPLASILLPGTTQKDWFQITKQRLLRAGILHPLFFYTILKGYQILTAQEELHKVKSSRSQKPEVTHGSIEEIWESTMNENMIRLLAETCRELAEKRKREEEEQKTYEEGGFGNNSTSSNSKTINLDDNNGGECDENYSYDEESNNNATLSCWGSGSGKDLYKGGKNGYQATTGGFGGYSKNNRGFDKFHNGKGNSYRSGGFGSNNYSLSSTDSNNWSLAPVSYGSYNPTPRYETPFQSKLSPMFETRHNLTGYESGLWCVLCESLVISTRNHSRDPIKSHVEGKDHLASLARLAAPISFDWAELPPYIQWMGMQNTRTHRYECMCCEDKSGLTHGALQGHISGEPHLSKVAMWMKKTPLPMDESSTIAESLGLEKFYRVTEQRED